MVIAMVALLASVAYFYQKMDAGRSSKGAGSESKSKQDLAVGVALQVGFGFRGLGFRCRPPDLLALRGLLRV